MNCILGFILGWILCSLIKNTELESYKATIIEKDNMITVTKLEYDRLQSLYRFMGKKDE